LEHSNTSIETIAMGTTEKYRKYQNKNIKTKSVAFACLPRLRYRPERSQPTAQTQYLNRASINRKAGGQARHPKGNKSGGKTPKTKQQKGRKGKCAQNAKPNRKRQFTP